MIWRIAFACFCTGFAGYLCAQDETAQLLYPDAGEQRSIDQLREIAESIKSCTPIQVPLDAEMEAEGFSDVLGPPVNVVWNVELHPSVRARYEGSVEFSEPSYLKMPRDDSYCNQPHINKNECRRRWMIGMEIYRRRQSHPFQFRYEFDLTPKGLEFVSASSKKRQIDDEAWVAEGMDADACAFKAIKSVPSSTLTTNRRPDGIPQLVWDGAEAGISDLQYMVGRMYVEGNVVPQDYAEAYFWMNLAASRSTDAQTRPAIVKARDEAASHLTTSVILRVQERTRQWTATR